MPKTIDANERVLPGPHKQNQVFWYRGDGEPASPVFARPVTFERAMRCLRNLKGTEQPEEYFWLETVGPDSGVDGVYTKTRSARAYPSLHALSPKRVCAGLRFRGTKGRDHPLVGAIRACKRDRIRACIQTADQWISFALYFLAGN